MSCKLLRIFQSVFVQIMQMQTCQFNFHRSIQHCLIVAEPSEEKDTPNRFLFHTLPKPRNTIDNHLSAVICHHYLTS